MPPEMEEIQPGTRLAGPPYRLPEPGDPSGMREWQVRSRTGLSSKSLSWVIVGENPAAGEFRLSATFAAVAGSLGAAAGSLVGGPIAAAIGGAIGGVLGLIAASESRGTPAGRPGNGVTILNSTWSGGPCARSPASRNLGSPTPPAAPASPPESAKGVGTMGTRLKWARLQQGITLRELSEQTSRAVGYLCELEKGNKNNPTRETLAALAKSLNVTVPFLQGEVPPAPQEEGMAPVTLTLDAGEMRRTFRRYQQQLSPKDKEHLLLGSVEDRFIRVIHFLCETYPEVFTIAVIAYQLGLPPRSLQNILHRSEPVSGYTLEQIVMITGIPIHFFSSGELSDALEPDKPCPALPTEIDLAALLRGRAGGCTARQ